MSFLLAAAVNRGSVGAVTLQCNLESTEFQQTKNKPVLSVQIRVLSLFFRADPFYFTLILLLCRLEQKWPWTCLIFIKTGVRFIKAYLSVSIRSKVGVWPRDSSSSIFVAPCESHSGQQQPRLIVPVWVNDWWTNKSPLCADSSPCWLITNCCLMFTDTRQGKSGTDVIARRWRQTLWDSRDDSKLSLYVLICWYC